MNSIMKHTQGMMDHFFGQQATPVKQTEKCLGCFQGSKNLDEDQLCLRCGMEQRQEDAINHCGR